MRKLADAGTNLFLALALSVGQSGSVLTRSVELSNDPCQNVIYDPDVGVLIRQNGSLIAVGTEGQGVELTGDHVDFANGRVDLIYHTRDGKKTSVDAARFQSQDGITSTKRVEVDMLASRLICPAHK